MYLSRAKDFHAKRQYDEERTQLEQALSHDAFNADILIAMYRIPEGSEEWQQRTQQRIDALADRFRSAILLADRNYQAAPSEENKVRLALMLNQFAWLAANTDGDRSAALESSLRSLELTPDDPGYLDTLAHCYYAVGELEQAVKHQRRAVEQEPGSGQIRLQLQLFEQALRQQVADSAGGPHASVEADSHASPSVPQGSAPESP